MTDRTQHKVRRLTATVWLLSGIIAIGVFTVALQFCSSVNPCASLTVHQKRESAPPA